MHFVDRTLYPNPPLAELQRINGIEQAKWLSYKAYQQNKALPKVAKPQSLWTDVAIKSPLVGLFKSNCGYCGSYADINDEGQVDHFFPVQKDTLAQHIYSWSNYVWSCPPCNKKKLSNHPLIDPCNEVEVTNIFFHKADGKYLIRKTASHDIKTKFTRTERKTLINSSNNPNCRCLRCHQLLNLYLPNIKRKYELYELEALADLYSKDTLDAFGALSQSIREMKIFLQTKEYLRLCMFLIEEYKRTNSTFPFSFDDFI